MAKPTKMFVIIKLLCRLLGKPWSHDRTKHVAEYYFVHDIVMKKQIATSTFTDHTGDVLTKTSYIIQCSNLCDNLGMMIIYTPSCGGAFNRIRVVGTWNQCSKTRPPRPRLGAGSPARPLNA